MVQIWPWYPLWWTFLDAHQSNRGLFRSIWRLNLLTTWEAHKPMDNVIQNILLSVIFKRHLLVVLYSNFDHYQYLVVHSLNIDNSYKKVLAYFTTLPKEVVFESLFCVKISLSLWCCSLAVCSRSYLLRHQQYEIFVTFFLLMIWQLAWSAISVNIKYLWSIYVKSSILQVFVVMKLRIKNVEKWMKLNGDRFSKKHKTISILNLNIGNYPQCLILIMNILLSIYFNVVLKPNFCQCQTMTNSLISLKLSQYILRTPAIKNSWANSGTGSFWSSQ